MKSKVEECLDMPVFSGNVGSCENGERILNNNDGSDDHSVFSSTNFANGNITQKAASATVPPDLEDVPVIPERYKVLDIGNETVKMSSAWAYRDKCGKVLFYVQRFDTKVGKKQFRPLTFFKTESGIKWNRKAPAEPRPLYGLDRLATWPDADVMVCEGEKPTDAATRLFPSVVAVSSMNGANSPEKSDWSVLAGRSIILWGDFDEPGKSYITAVEKLVVAAGGEVKHAIRSEWFLQMGNELGIKREALPVGWDAADAELEGFTADKIQSLLDLKNNSQGDNMLFGFTPSQEISKVEGVGKNNNDKTQQEAVAAERRAQVRELFKDSEFNVFENRKGFKNGVYWQEPFREDDVPKPAILLCSPLIIVAETRDTDQSNWGRLLAWLDNDGHAHNWACPVEILAATDTAEFRRELVRNGLTIATNSKARQKLVDYVLGFKPQSPDRVRCVTKTGWYGDIYVLANRVYGKQEGESMIYQGATNGDYATAGTLVDWQREVAARAVGNSRIVFAISTAFSGVLVEMAGESGGGFQFTGTTSKGKTSTLIDPAASVWGVPDRFAKKWRTTANGLEAMCLSRNHSTLMLDDLGQSDARECGQSAYLIANGQGKARMQKEGGNRPLSTWKTMILSSGELDISEHMAESGKIAKGGQVARLPSIPADAGGGMFSLEHLHDQPDGRHFSDTMKSVTRKYYGTAGEAFLEQLTNPATLRETNGNIRDCLNEIVKLMAISDEAAPEVGRVAARFALVAFSGELATQFGVTGWDKGEALKAAIRCFNDWLSDADGIMGADNKALFSQISAFLQAHGSSRFPPHDISSIDLQRVQNRAGFSYINDNNVSYWAESGAFMRELCKGFNYKAAAKTLIKAGWLEPSSGRTQQKKRINAVGGKGLWFYVLTDKALGGNF
ncbi:DUF927 domain-containing protein [Gallionella capsiferriformans]|uniref:DUF927 domain-containing protein n=1 Tax=Gallionella capsiferriformans (strain ES-2) TaxID=395494 RepID=D9SDK7_GALCS|nr:DUF927 domain-containing protein [Gallionella capsiferriformans]ADL54764.1 protein of unknown function DUF927 [Gallionella capsiferriformans ES-2]